MTEWRVGMKAVCVDASNDANDCPLREGDIYTVREVRLTDASAEFSGCGKRGAVDLSLMGMADIIRTPNSGVWYQFNSARFRPLTDIEIQVERLKAITPDTDIPDTPDGPKAPVREEVT